MNRDSRKYCARCIAFVDVRGSSGNCSICHEPIESVSVQDDSVLDFNSVGHSMRVHALSLSRLPHLLPLFGGELPPSSTSVNKVANESVLQSLSRFIVDENRSIFRTVALLLTAESSEKKLRFKGVLASFSSLETSLSGPLAISNPFLADSLLLNAEEMGGSIAVVKRGACTFVEKAKRAEAAGAVATIIVQEGSDWPYLIMDSSPSAACIRVPVLMVSAQEGLLLTKLIRERQFVNCQLSMDPCDEQCVICQHSYECRASIAFLPCLHVFHDDCVRQWLTGTSATCPSCRYNLLTAETVDGELEAMYT